MFQRIGRHALLLPIVLVSPIAQAVEVAKPTITPVATLGKLVLALMAVLIVFWVFARVMRQLQGAQSGAHSGLKCIGALSLGQRERVVVVQAGDQQLVLGVTASQINTLHVLDNPLLNDNSDITGDFRQKLSLALKRQVAN